MGLKIKYLDRNDTREKDTEGHAIFRESDEFPEDTEARVSYDPGDRSICISFDGDKYIPRDRYFVTDTKRRIIAKSDGKKTEVVIKGERTFEGLPKNTIEVVCEEIMETRDLPFR
jgi:hypothetical protein